MMLLGPFQQHNVIHSYCIGDLVYNGEHIELFGATTHEMRDDNGRRIVYGVKLYGDS